MKKYLYLLTAAVCAGFTSCGDDNKESTSETTLQVAQTSVTFEATGGSASVAVASNTAWSVAGGADWLAVSKAENAVNLTAQSNGTTESKETTVMVKTDNGARSQSIKVSIKGVEAASIVGIWKHDVAGYSGAYEIIRYNADGTGFNRSRGSSSNWGSLHNFTYRYENGQLTQFYSDSETKTYIVSHLTATTLVLDKANTSSSEYPKAFVRITEQELSNLYTSE